MKKISKICWSNCCSSYLNISCLDIDIEMGILEISETNIFFSIVVFNKSREINVYYILQQDFWHRPIKFYRKYPLA